MASISLTLPVSGTQITAGLHATNYGAIQTAINGGLDNTNIASGAAIAAAKLAGYPSDSTKFLRGDGTWAAGSAGAAYRKTTSKAVNTSTTATDLLNGEITVGAGVLGTTGLLRLTAWGDMLNNSGGASALPRFQLLLGGTTVLDTGTPASAVFSSGATRGSWRVRGEVLNAGSASAQVASMFIAGGFPLSPGNDAGVAFTTGVGEYGSTAINGGTGSSANPNHLHGEGTNTGLAVNTALAAALVLNVINGLNNASYETRLLGAIVEVL